MTRSRTLLSVVLGLGMAGAMAYPTLAQDAPPPPPPDGGGAGGPGAPGGGPGGWGGGRFDPAQMRERMNQRTKEALGVTDEEWKALQPKIDQVRQLQFQSMAGRFGGRGGRGGGPGGPGGDMASSPVAQASRDLRETLDNQGSTPDQIKAKLQALRDARAKARDELTAAQNDLKQLLTARQEAVLVQQGLLE